MTWVDYESRLVPNDHRVSQARLKRHIQAFFGHLN